MTNLSPGRVSKAILLLIVVLIVGAVLGAYAYYNRATSPSLTNLPEGWKIYTDPDFHLSLGYPASWTKGGFDTLPPSNPDAPGAYTIRTGGYSNADHTAFFYTSNAHFSTRPVQMSIDAYVSADINHLLKPYGTNPSVQKLMVGGQTARLVTPSVNGEEGLFLYVECPTKCGIFFLNADKDHMAQIIQTMKFQ